LLVPLGLVFGGRLADPRARHGDRGSGCAASQIEPGQRFLPTIWGASMITSFDDPFDALLSLQRELESRLASDWLHDLTTSRGPFPPINVFQQGDDILAIVELPGIDKNDLQIQAKENTIRISGKKNVAYSEEASVHRRERVSGEFDRTLSLPVQFDPDRIQAEYRDGLLALYLPRAESDKPHTIKVK
jgi:HSP20 family protein